MPKPPPSRPPTRSSQPAAEPAEPTLQDAQPIDANATMLMPPASEGQKPRRAGAAKLVVTAGPKAGEEFPLGPGETTLGRQGDNTIVVPDISVSRRHVAIRKDGAGYKLSDLGSGNGTLLNGQPVQGEVELQDGDSFSMGDTVITFQAPQAASAKPKPAAPLARRSGAPIPSRPAPRRAGVGLGEDESGATGRHLPPSTAAKPKGKSAVSKIAVALVALLVVGGIGLLYVKRSQEIASKEARARKDAEAAAAIQERIAAAAERGKTAMKAGDFKTAVEAFTEAQAIAKEQGKDDRDIKNRLEYSKKEVGNQEAIEAARKAAEAGDLTLAFDALKGIPEDSYFGEKLAEVRAGIRATIPARLQVGRDALSAKDLDGARKAIADVQAVDPSNAEAQALARAIEAATPGQSAGSSNSNKAATPPTSGAPDPTERPLASFKAGKLDEAIGLTTACDDPKCKKLLEKLSAFRDVYKDLDAEGNAEKASDRLRAIPGGNASPFQAEIGAKAATSLVKEGIRHMGSDNLPKAFQAFRKASQLDPGNAVAEKHLRSIYQKAKDLSTQAYVDMSVEPEKACKEYEQVVRITAPEDELHQKAKKRMKEKCGSGGGD